MQRRTFLASSAAFAATAGLPLTASAVAAPIDVMAAIKALRIPSGPFAGGYEMAPNGRLNWYFTSLALVPLVQWMPSADRETYIRPYLDLYLRNLTAQYTIADVDFPLGRADPTRYSLVPSDSDDSYAATILSLAARYFHANNATAWWGANVRKLKGMAYYNIARMVKTNGLTSVFQPPRNQQNATGYLMDNCEVYRGLRDFAQVLRETGDADASYYDSFATTIGRAIYRLFHTTSGSFLAGDEYRSPETSFYPGTTCQVFPEVFGVVEAKAGFAPAFAYLNRYSPGWETGKFDPYAWMVLGTGAAKRGARTQATAQLRMLDQKFVTQRSLVTINELGFYRRTQSILEGAPEV